MGLILESPVKGPVKSWNSLGYNVAGGHSDAGADAKICKRQLILSRYEKITDSWGCAPDPIVTAVCLYI